MSGGKVTKILKNFMFQDLKSVRIKVFTVENTLSNDMAEV